MLKLGYNYRITDFQCALGISQLSQINKFIIKRRKIAQMYNKFLSSNHLIKLKRIWQNLPFVSLICCAYKF